MCAAIELLAAATAHALSTDVGLRLAMLRGGRSAGCRKEQQIQNPFESPEDSAAE
jgi:hypothetical protein